MMAEVRLRVAAGRHSRRDCPVDVVLPEGDWSQAAGLEQQGGGQVPCQAYEADGEWHLAWIIPALAAGQELQYVARAWEEGRPGRESAERVAIERIGDHALDVKVSGELFTRYHYADAPARPYFYPVIGPEGTHVTRSFPMEEGPPGEDRDHPHHRSLWVAHGDLNGADNWSEERGHAFEKHIRFDEVSAGPVFGRIVAANDWVSADGAKVCEEQRTATIYNITGDRRIMDLDVIFRATEGPVVFGDTKEGGIASVRVASSMNGSRGGLIENSYGGLTEAETWGKRAQWCDYSGQVEGAHLGITIFDHPDSFRYPTWWHVRDYGLMTANPFGWSAFYDDPGLRGDYTLLAGEPLMFRYRIMIHRGDAKQGQVAQRYNDYVNPPRVAMEA